MINPFPWCGSTENTACFTSSIVVTSPRTRKLRALHSNGCCLQSHLLTINLYATVYSASLHIYFTCVEGLKMNFLISTLCLYFPIPLYLEEFVGLIALILFIPFHTRGSIRRTAPVQIKLSVEIFCNFNFYLESCCTSTSTVKPRTTWRLWIEEQFKFRNETDMVNFKRN
jgi:hypothetical protein